MTDSEKVKHLRKNILKASQGEFAEQVGITQGAISDVERGKYSLSSDALSKMFVAYGVNPNWWFFNEEPPLLKDKTPVVPKERVDELEQQVRKLQEEVINYQRKELNQRQS